MIRPWLVSGLVVILTASLLTTTLAEDDWKLPRILPFPSKKARPAQSPQPRKKTTSSLIRPVSALVPDVLDITRRPAGGPSPLDRLTTGTKKLHQQTSQAIASGAKKVSDDTKTFLTKSKEVLLPWSESPSTSRRSGSRRGSSSDRASGGGLLALPKWWSTDDRPPQPAPVTMSDWLGQPRPGD